MTHLYLIRHAEALNAVQHRFGDLDLTPRGIRQAERLRDRLATGEIAADVLISSTLRRAYQTAEIIAPALGLPIIPDDEVQEMHEGQAAGLSEEEFVARFGPPDFEQNPFRPGAPEGESWPEFMLRVGRALQRITHEYADKTIVVVCHGGVIDGSFIYFFGLSSFSIPSVRFHTENTSITHWYYGASFPREHACWHLLAYNDTCHLRGME
ncbi:MAG: histidine phosphatase family protein [Thermogemmatispora sp.]|uniref:histidine phosphatase family protein n=1 Tax=Thermogemmatispora sp. TaxID=1968838 RepID=UPI002613C027|nr:histidine phosphatase family protein [Thermogemmatispora sp.]MBX5456579.1 histidine phosphatase family protein [Thermogemmatispora sp.]